MALIQRTLKSLLPRGIPWEGKGLFRAFVNAVGDSVQEVYDFFARVRAESNAGTAEETLPEWYAQLGIRYDPTRTLRTRQRRARQQWAALGGQNIVYLREVIQTAFPDVDVLENLASGYTGSMAGSGQAGVMQAMNYPSWVSVDEQDEDDFGDGHFLVFGKVETFPDFDALQNLIEKIMPAQLEPIYEVTIRAAEPIAEAGIAMAGFAQSGRLQGE